MTKKQQQVEIARLNQDLTELTGMYESLQTLLEKYRKETDSLNEQVKVLEMGTKLDKERILTLEADLAINRLRLHRTTERANMLQKTIDGISFSM